MNLSGTCTKWVEAMGRISGIKKIENKKHCSATLVFVRDGIHNRIGLIFPKKYCNTIVDGMYIHLAGNLRIIYTRKNVMKYKYVIYANKIWQMDADTNEGYAKAYLSGQIANLTYTVNGLEFDCVLQSARGKEYFKCHSFGHNAFAVAAANHSTSLKMKCELSGNENDFIKITVLSLNESDTAQKAATGENLCPDELSDSEEMKKEVVRNVPDFCGNEQSL